MSDNLRFVEPGWFVDKLKFVGPSVETTPDFHTMTAPVRICCMHRSWIKHSGLRFPERITNDE
jgi:hypothetical protein